MRKKLKPDQEPEAIQEYLLDQITTAYGECGSLNKTAQELGLSLMKVRKALITAKVYSSDTSEEVRRLIDAGKSVEDISAILNITPAAVYGYLPYKRTAYGLKDENGNDVTTVNADKTKRYKVRKKVVDELKAAIESDLDWTGCQGYLWKAIMLYAGQNFRTAGRGRDHKGAVGFSYELKISSRTGETTDELVISTRDAGKTITRSSVELALEKYLEVQAETGYVKGPKSAGQIFGASYLYSIFLKWGVIRCCQEKG